MGGAIDLALVAAAVSTAAWLQPWRQLRAAGPPWVWIVVAAVLPGCWNLGGQAGPVVLPPLSGAVLLTLMAGWPLAMLATVPVALASAWGGGWDLLESLHRAAWLGVVPATLALGLGAAARRWLPRHLCCYVAVRAFFGAGLVVFIAGALGAWPSDDGWTALLLVSLAEAGVTSTLVTAFVVWRPDLLATYADRLYLPSDAGAVRIRPRRAARAGNRPRHPRRRSRAAPPTSAARTRSR
jgi:uncharacterized membrane protein